MPTQVHAFQFLSKPPPLALPSLVVLFGGQRYLVSLVLAHLRSTQDDEEWTESRLDTEAVTWADVADELAANSLFGGDASKRVIVNAADEFVTNHRDRLEVLATQSSKNVLVLGVDKWPKNTRLYKLVNQHGLAIECSVPQIVRGKSSYPDLQQITPWLIARAKTMHGVKLTRDGAVRLGELTDFEIGRMDQELAKMVVMLDSGESVSAEVVQRVVGGWQLQTAWKIADAIADGEMATVIALLDQLFHSGDETFGLFAQLAWSLRRYGYAHEHYVREKRINARATLDNAIRQAGFWPSEAAATQRRMARMGPQRLGQMSQRLLDVDEALKRTHSHEQRSRVILEKLIFWLADEKTSPAAAVAR